MAFCHISAAVVGFVAVKTIHKIWNDEANNPPESTISFEQIRQLIRTKIKYTVSDIKYIGHGEDFDSFAITIDSNKYVIRIARHNKHELVFRLMLEIKYLSLLKPHFLQHNVSIQIPSFDDEACKQLRNLDNPHKAFIYATYPKIEANNGPSAELLKSNKQEIARFLAALHDFEPHESDLEYLATKANEELECTYF